MTTADTEPNDAATQAQAGPGPGEPAPEQHAPLTTSEAAAYLGATLNHIRDQIRLGHIASTCTPGRHRRIAVSELVRYVRASGIPSFTPDDRLVLIGTAAKQIGVNPIVVLRAIAALNVPCIRSTGARQSAGWRRIRQRDISAIQAHIIDKQ